MSKGAVFTGLVIFIVVLGVWASRQTVPVLDQVQRREEIGVPLDMENAVGQSIQAGRCSGYHFRILLKSMDISASTSLAWLDVDVQPLSDTASDAVRTRRYPLAWLYLTRQINIHLPASSTHLDNGCLLHFQTNAPPGMVALRASPGDAYSGGSLTLNDYLVDSDLAFTVFQPLNLQETGWRMVSVLPQFIGLLGLTIFYIILGWAFLVVMGDQRRGLLSSLLTGMAAAVVLMAFFSLMRLPFNSSVVWGCLIALGLAAAGRIGFPLLKQGRGKPLRQVLQEHDLLPRQVWSYPDLAVAASFVLALWVRLIQTAVLPAPPWVDAFFHAYLLRGFAESGMIPLDLNYPFGFHVLAYVNGLLTDWTIPASLLHTGQWLGALSGLAFYRLADAVFHRKIAAFLGALLFWFYAPFPAYLINWSRFPLLLGIILACGLLAWIKEGKHCGGRLILIVLALAMTHYATLVLVILAGLSVWMVNGGWGRLWHLVHWHRSNGFSIRAFRWWLLLLPVAIFLFSRLLNLYQQGAFAAIVAENRKLATGLDLMYYLRLALQRGGIIFWPVSTAGAICLIRKQRQVFTTGFSWILPMTVFIAVQMILLGGSFPGMNNIFVWLFIPFSMAGGYILAVWLDKIASIFTKNKYWVTPMLVIYLMICGAWSNIGFFNPQTVLANQNDQKALDWAQANIPPGSVFLVHSFAWGNEYQPSDGGGWLPNWGDFEIHYPQTLREVSEFADFLQTQKIQYYYQGRGTVWHDRSPLTGLLEDGKLIYAQEGVQIYQLH